MATDKPFQKLSVIRGSLFEDEHYDYLTTENSQLKSLREGFRKRKYAIAQVGLPYRLMNYWDEQGVLPNPSREDKSQWRKFTYIEIVWLRVVMRLRDFGVPLQKIAEIKNCVMEADEKAGAYPLFEFYFYKAIVNDGDHYVAYFPDGIAGLISARQLEYTKHFIGDQDILLISLKAVAKSMGLGVAKSRPFFSLSKAEEELITHARLAHTKEVKARVSKGRVVEVEDTKVYSDVSLLRQITDSMKDEKKFGEITTSIENGKRQAVSVKSKKRFR